MILGCEKKFMWTGPGAKALRFELLLFEDKHFNPSKNKVICGKDFKCRVTKHGFLEDYGFLISMWGILTIFFFRASLKDHDF